MIRIAGLLHNIGLLGVPARVMTKPDILSVTEMQLMRQHPGASEMILQELPGFEEISIWIARHHERPDGKGYPDMLSGAHPADRASSRSVFAALTTERPHRGAVSREDARRILPGAGTQRRPRVGTCIFCAPGLRPRHKVRCQPPRSAPDRRRNNRTPVECEGGQTWRSTMLSTHRLKQIALSERFNARGRRLRIEAPWLRWMQQHQLPAAVTLYYYKGSYKQFIARISVELGSPARSAPTMAAIPVDEFTKMSRAAKGSRACDVRRPHQRGRAQDHRPEP
jgi:hypothetical protein